MFAKIVRGKDPIDLEKAMNEFLTDHAFVFDGNESAKKLFDEVKKSFPYMQTTVTGNKKSLRIYQVQQFIMQEVDAKSVSIINQQPVVKVSICLLLICGYE